MGWREGQAIYRHRKILLELHMKFFPSFQTMRIGVSDLRVLQERLPQELRLQCGVAMWDQHPAVLHRASEQEPTQNCR